MIYAALPSFCYLMSHPKLFYLMLVTGKECYFCKLHVKCNGCNFSPSKDREIDEGWWGRKGAQQKRFEGKWDALRWERWKEKVDMHSSIFFILHCSPEHMANWVFKRHRMKCLNVFFYWWFSQEEKWLCYVFWEHVLQQGGPLSPDLYTCLCVLKR